MKIILLNAPGGYPYMPYLATAMLKGFIEENSNYIVNQADVNLDYCYYNWTKKSLIKILNNINNLDLNNNENLYYYTLCDYIKDNIENTYTNLKNKDTYRFRVDVEKNLDILNSVIRLINFIDKKNGYVKKFQPNKLNDFDEILTNYELSYCSKWIDENIDNYNISDFDLVGISITYIGQLIPSLYIARKIKEKYPTKKILIGGALTVHFKDEILKDLSIWNNIDYCIFNQGEELIINLLDNLKENRIKNIKNIAYINNDKIIYEESINRKSRPQGIPSFDGIDFKKFPTPEPIIPILTSKGCYWRKCTYCSHFESYGDIYYKFTLDTVKNTIKKIKEKHGAQYFYFVDEALPYKMIHELSKFLIKENINIKWYGETRIDTFNEFEKILSDLKQSGCIYLVSGIESGSEKVLTDMRKGIDLKYVEKHIKNCYEHDIGVLGMFFTGFPTENEYDAEKTYKFIEKNKNYLTYATVGVFSLERGTDIYKNMNKYNIEYIENYNMEYADSPNYKLKSENDISLYDTRLKRKQLLMDKYQHINYKFTGELPREYLIFLKDMNSDSSINISCDKNYKVIIKAGTFKGKKGLLNLKEGKLHILK